MPKEFDMAQYKHERAVLEQALKEDIIYRVTTPDAARYFRQRVYNLRRRLKELDWFTHKADPRHRPSTPYDNLVLRITPQDQCAVMIVTVEPSARGFVEKLDAGTIEPLLKPSEFNRKGKHRSEVYNEALDRRAKFLAKIEREELEQKQQEKLPVEDFSNEIDI